MRAIWKFSVDVKDHSIVTMPAGAKILHINTQRGDTERDVQLWAMVDTTASQEWYEIAFIGTGHEVPDHCTPENYIGTVALHGGALVFHAFLVR